MVETISLGIIN